MVNQLDLTKRIRVKDLNVVYNDDLDAPDLDLAAFDPKNLPAGWNQMGYLSRSQTVEIPRSGGEVTVDDTLNETAVDSEQAAIQRDMTFAVEQVEDRILKVIYGDDVVDPATGIVWLPDTPVAKTRKYNVIYTGTKGQVKGWTLTGSLSSTADLSMDVTKTSAIPVSIKVLNHNGHGLGMMGYAAPSAP